MHGEGVAGILQSQLTSDLLLNSLLSLNFLSELSFGSSV